MDHTISEDVGGGLVKLTRTDTGVVLWAASRDGESIVSYHREHVERWLTLGPLDPACR